MVELHLDRPHPEPIVLNIGGDVGALIIYTPESHHRKEIEVSLSSEPDHRTHVEVLERPLNGKTVFAAAYPELVEGEYLIWGENDTVIDRATVSGGEITTIDWR